MSGTDKIKIFYPDTINDQDVTSDAMDDPTSSGSTSTSSAVGTGNTINSTSSVSNSSLPSPVVAHELVNTSLDTQSKKILGTYTFGEVGAMQVGEYINGTSGDLRITPDGITARNSAGTTTFSIDGTTGNATFLGTVAAGSVISATMSANNLTAGTIDASVITVTNIDADNISTGTLSADRIGANSITAAKIAANTITASEIAANTITASQIQASTITATEMNVSQLSAIAADVGAITAGTITGVTITGGTLQTATTGQRVVITGASNDIVFYSANGTNVGFIRGDNTNGLFIGTETNQNVFITAIGASGSINLTAGDATYVSGDITLAPAYSINTSFIRSSSGSTVTFIGDDIGMNDNSIKDVSTLSLTARTNPTAGNRELTNEDESGGDQRLRFKFENNGNQWSIDMTSICTPVEQKDYDPLYFEQYELQTDLCEERFEKRFADSKEIQQEYRGKPTSHYPSSGTKGTEPEEHRQAMMKRPWLPMKTFPDRMETMGQYPYPPVHSKLIGYGEAKENLYQLTAHAYNKAMERIDELENRITTLESRQ